MVRTPTLAQKIGALLVVLAIAGSTGDAHPEQGAAVTVLRWDVASYPEVSVYVAVCDERGNPVPGLNAGNFQVSEEGEPVGGLTCTVARPDEQRLALVLVIDTSGSMKGAPLVAAKRAVLDLISRLGPQDHCTVTGFSARVTEIAQFRGNDSSAARALNALRARGDTALFDAVVHAAERVRDATADRKAVVILTDGRDTASATARSEAISQAQKSGVALYLIGLGPRCDRAGLKAMAAATGGAAYFTGAPDELSHIYRQVLDRVRCFYALRYHSPGGNPGSRRTFRVEVVWDGVSGADSRQYILPTRLAEPRSPWGWLRAHALALGVGTLILINLLLATAVIVIRRRHAFG